MTNSNAATPFAIWHGMERKNIDWHPTVDESKCTGCGLCVVTCGEKRNVFDYDLEKSKSVVMSNGPVCGCGRRGCLEAIAGGRGIARRVSENITAGRNSLHNFFQV